jgi:hypothetical protein
MATLDQALQATWVPSVMGLNNLSIGCHLWGRRSRGFADPFRTILISLGFLTPLERIGLFLPQHAGS